MSWFVNKYLRDKYQDTGLNILDLGSQIVPKQAHLGSYRQFFPNLNWTYTGADIVPGDNVDVVLQSQYQWQFPDDSFDVIVSGQTIEHVKFPWLWFNEMARVLKPKGLCCIIAPCVAGKHNYPIDTFRYYPDGMNALAEWSGLTPIKTRRNEIFYDRGDTSKHPMQDCYMVATK